MRKAIRIGLAAIACGVVTIVAVVVSIATSSGSPEFLRWAYAYWLSSTDTKNASCQGVGGELVANTLVVADIAVYGDRHFALTGSEECREAITGTSAVYTFEREYDLVGFTLTATGRAVANRAYITNRTYLEASTITGTGHHPIDVGAETSMTVFVGLVKHVGVERVVFRYSSGTTVGRQVSGDLVAVNAIGNQGVCEMTAYGTAGQVLEFVDLRAYNWQTADLSGC